MNDSASQLRSATRRAKSDVANKMVSMFLHELSRSISRKWGTKVDSEEYAAHVREIFGNRCPYCIRNLTNAEAVVEHLDGMNKLRAGLHVPGNVLVACKRCNSEKRRDDSIRVLTLGSTGWESFLSHDETRCSLPCGTCHYWATVWPDSAERKRNLHENLDRIRLFRQRFPDFESVIPKLQNVLPGLLAKLYSDCQDFAEREIRVLLEQFHGCAGPQ